MLVADADLVSYPLIPVPRTTVALAVFARDAERFAPANQRVEMLNVISKNVRKETIDLSAGIAAFDAVTELIKIHAEHPIESTLLKLSVHLRTSTYDSVCVWLARHLNVRLVTGDAGLVRCAPDVAVSMEDFASGK